MKKKLLLAVGALYLSWISVYAQVAASSMYNSSGQVYNFTNDETFTNDANGVAYVSRSSGEFYHLGPANATLTVNGFFNAFDPNINGFIGTPAAPGIDYFQGLDGLKNTAQEIAGTVAPRFGILKLDNGPNPINITNTNGVEIGLRVNFTNGITTTVRSNTNTGAITFLDNATYTGAGSGSLTAPNDFQHVDGYVTKLGNDGFVFPIGSNTDARPLQISAPWAITDSYSTAWIPGDPTTTPDPSGSPALHPIANKLAPIISVSPVGQWDWIAINGTGDGLGITVSIPDMSAFSDVLSLRLVGWDGTQWIDLSGGPAASNNTENSTLSGTMVPGITAIGIGKNPTTIVLPLAVNSFAGIISSCQAKLQWSTSTEVNTSHYEIEYSTNGAAFSTIGAIASLNNTRGGTYNYTFANLIRGANFFRIRTINKQGTSAISDIIKLDNNCGIAPRIIISPNPTNDYIYITGMQGKNTVLVLDASGRKLTQLATEQYAERINLKAFAKGTYIVRIINDNGTVTNEKVIKR